MADPGSSRSSRLTLHGRVLAAVSAVSKDDADKFREDRDKQGAAKTDRRNLYLMREGGKLICFWFGVQWLIRSFVE